MDSHGLQCSENAWLVYSKSESLTKLPFVQIMYTTENKNEKSMVGSVTSEELK
jgi:hypothetical protein